MKDAETILAMTREECLRNMQSENEKTRRAWFYTHCGEIEMAGFAGLITIERMNELESEWFTHKNGTVITIKT